MIDSRRRCLNDHAYACMIECDNGSMVLDFAIERLYDVGIP